MRKIAMLVAASIAIGVGAVGVPGIAEARFGAGVIADAAAGLSVTQPAQYQRSQRAYRRNTATRTYAPPQSSTVSPYRYPGSRGALDSCSFC